MSESSGVNVNTATASIAEPIVNTGAGVTDFDDLESLEKLTAKAPKKSKSEGEGAENAKGSDDYAKDEVKSADKGKAKEEAVKEKKAEKAKRLYKMKMGETVAELAPDGVLELTVDGKLTPVQFQDLVNNYAGKTAWDKKFSELDRDRKGFYSERENLSKTVSKFYDLAVKQGDPLAALEHIAEAFQTNPAELRKSYRDRMLESATQWQGKSPEEIQAHLDQLELSTARKREASQVEARETAKIQADLEARIEKVVTTHSVDADAFRQAYQDLVTHGVKDITPETVGEYLGEIGAMKEIAGVLQQVAPDMSREAMGAAMQELRSLQQKDGFSAEDLKDIAKQVYGKPNPAARLAKKVQSQRSQGASAGQPANFSQEPMTFDEI